MIRDTTTEPTEHTLASAKYDQDKRTDAQLAYTQVMAGRNDLDLVSIQYSARNRILKLSCEVWELRAALRDALRLLNDHPRFIERKAPGFEGLDSYKVAARIEALLPPDTSDIPEVGEEFFSKAKLTCPGS